MNMGCVETRKAVAKKTKIDLERIAAAIAVSRPTFSGRLFSFRFIAPKTDEDLCLFKGKGK